MAKKNKPLSALVEESMAAFPVSGEINNTVEDPAALIQLVEETYRSEAQSIDHTDGISMIFDNWRFNLRASNTEPVVRLNVESRSDERLMLIKTDELLALIRS
jgi:phosphomannomutase